MDKNWLSKGAPPKPFTWHGGRKKASSAAIVDLQQKLKEIWYLEKALEVSRAVARVWFPGGKLFATCFLVAPDLVLTNHHVFGKPEDTANVKIQFNYRRLADGDLAPVEEFSLNPAATFITDKTLDFTLVALAKAANIGNRAYLPIMRDLTPPVQSHVAIIQHPNGQTLQVAMRDNSLQFTDDSYLEYLTNTDYGSSGAPVFDDTWRLIALHSQRVKDPTRPTTVWYRNKGTRFAAILRNAEVASHIPPA